ncbi:MAG: GMC family oxidoreductase, partial [Pseudorhodoplanes sp.]
PITMNDTLASMRSRLAAGLDYVLFRKGLLALSAAYAGGFFRTDPKVASPDIQVHLVMFSTDAMGAAFHPFPGFVVSACQLRPESRGFVRIKSADPRTAPAIQPLYLSAAADRDAVLRGMKLIRRIMNGDAIRRYVVAEREPGPDCTTDDQMLAYVRNTAMTIYHPVGTSRMGRDPDAVVDDRLRVHGIGGLRVIDGSIMPTLVSGNTNAAVVMIAEKGADMVLEDAKAKATGVARAA